MLAMRRQERKTSHARLYKVPKKNAELTKPHKNLHSDGSNSASTKTQGTALERQAARSSAEQTVESTFNIAMHAVLRHTRNIIVDRVARRNKFEGRRICLCLQEDMLFTGPSADCTELNESQRYAHEPHSCS